MQAPAPDTGYLAFQVKQIAIEGFMGFIVRVICPLSKNQKFIKIAFLFFHFMVLCFLPLGQKN